MSLGTTLLLGFIAGVTILLGIPLGRINRPMLSAKVVLNGVAVGILMFLIWDVFSAAWEPIDEALAAHHEHTGGLGPAFGYGALFAGGLTVGLLGLVAYDRYLARVATSPGAGVATWSMARRMSLLIAVGIGLHNFAEGLAIGQAAASDEIGLATLLVVGFALHNATEGFGIVAPLAGDLDSEGQARVPSWGFLLGLGAIGGAPTFLGTWIGHSVTSEPLAVLFLSLAAGSIVYVIMQLLGIAARARRSDLVAYGLLVGLLAGFLTDAIVTAAGV